MSLEKATFGAGCFWHVQEEFDKVKGVKKSEVGFMGGNVPKPTYKQVCTDKTGHAEVVHLEFDPKKVSYQKLLNTFFSLHDPTQLNRDGPNIGTQYRSVIFCHTEQQKELAEKAVKALHKASSKKIVTQVVPASDFYRAEDYHQKYMKKCSSIFFKI